MKSRHVYAALPALVFVCALANPTIAAPPRLPAGLDEDSWTAALTAAVKADGWREQAQSTPTLYRELEVPIPQAQRAAMNIAATDETTRTIPVSVLAGGPVGCQPEGVLSGKIVYSNAGHGWTHEADKGVWYTQRPLLFEMVEDMGNTDQLSLFADWCWRSGATFVPLKPVGHQPNERVIDNDNRHAKWQGAWFDAPAGKESLHFGPGDARVPYRFALATADDASLVRYRPVLNREGIYPVYVWARDGEDRVAQTYRVMHRGGATEVVIDHRRVGKGWVWLGSFPFARGDGGFVEITSKVSDPALADGKHVVIADAVRFGNGMGDINRGNGISGYPREEEASLYWVERMLPENGFATQLAQGRIESSSNVGAPPRTTAYMNNENVGSKLDRIFLGWHSNALDRTKTANGRGATGLYCETPALRTDHQIEFGEECARVINDMLSSQTALGKVLPVAYDEFTTLTFSQIDFGEIRADYLANEMSSTIVEVAFHDDEPDTVLLRSPFVRSLFARAMVQTIANVFANHGALTADKALLAPGAPDLLAATTNPDGKAQLVVRPADKDEAQRVSQNTDMILYASADGIGFDGGTKLNAADMKPLAGMPGCFEITTGDSVKTAPRFYRLTARNAGGESRPSWTMGTYEGRTTGTRLKIASVLPVPARLETHDDLTLTQTVLMNIHSPLGEGGDLSRFAPELTQTGMENIAPAQTLGDMRMGFDTIAVRERALNTGDYKATIVSTGRRAKLPALAQPAFTVYDVSAGRRIKTPALFAVSPPLFISGSADNAASQMTDTAAVRETVTSAPRTLRLSTEKFGLTLSGAAANMVLNPSAKAKVLMHYDDELQQPALIAEDGKVTAGFPLESVIDPDAKRALMTTALEELGVKTEPAIAAPRRNANAPRPATPAAPRRANQNRNTARRTPR